MYEFLQAVGSACCDIIQKTGFCVLRFHRRDRGYDLLRASGSTGPVYYRNWVLRLGIFHTRQGIRLHIRALGSASYDISHEIRRNDLLRALDSISCDISYETAGTFYYDHWVYDIIDETRGTICSGHWLLCLMISLAK